MKCPNCNHEINPAAELAKLGKGIPKPRVGYNGGWPARRRNKLLTELNADGNTFDEVSKGIKEIDCMVTQLIKIKERSKNA